jgi:divalent metal cation (Fe/Co/Zn/Cd) transporter
VEVHLLFPDGTALRDAHNLATEVERSIEGASEIRACVTTHLECASDNHHPIEVH